MVNNKKSKKLLLAFFICVTCILMLPVAGFTMTGTGTSEDPYMIYDAVDLQNIKNNLNANYKLANDIDLSGINFIPIGNNTTPFKGTLDGAGYTIKNLSINSEVEYTGLFGYTSSGTIQNININRVNITSTQDYTGALAGYISGTTIQNVNITVDKITSDGNYTGGLAGYASYDIVYGYTHYFISNVHIKKAASDSTISGRNFVGGLIGYGVRANTKSSSSKVNIFGDNDLGGFIGYSSVVVIDKTYATGNVTGVGSRIGGSIGYAEGYRFQNSFAYGNVSGNSDVGGFIGYARGKDGAYVLRVLQCYSIGQVSATTTDNIGAFSGAWGQFVYKVENCYYDSSKTSVGDSLARAMTHEDSFRQATYREFDFNTIWAIDEGTSTPYLQGMPRPDGDIYLSSNADLSDSSIYTVTSGIFTITPITVDANATVTVNGQGVDSGSSFQVPLNNGTNSVTIVVTAEDGVTTKTYYATFDIAMT